MFSPKKIFTAFFLFLLITGTCYSQQSELSYLALGDSYTIGEKVAKDMRWPILLVDSLRSHGYEMAKPKIIAKTGWTTDELMQAINDAELNPPYNLVSLLIGVNNQYRGYDISQFRKEFSTLLKKSITFAGGKNNRIFVVSIPDYGATPFGQKKNPEKIARELSDYNRLARKIAESHDVTFINITPMSRKAKNDPSLVAPDALHPSGKMYQQWVSKILPEITSKLQ